MRRIHAVSNIIIYFALVQVIGPIIAKVVYMVNHDIKSAFACYLLVQVIALIVIALTCSFALKSSFKRFKIKYFTYILLGYVVYLFLSVVISVILMQFDQQIMTSENQQTLNILFSQLPVALVTINVVLIAPILEELVFRYSLCYLFIGKKGLKANKILLGITFITACLVFALIHVSSELINSSGFDLVTVIIPYIIISSALTIIYFKTRLNILASIGLHILVNSIATITIILGAK